MEKMIAREERESFAMGLERHVIEEEDILGKYTHLGGLLKAGPAGLLIRHIFLDEQHHHFLLREMSKRLKEPLAEKPMAAVEKASQAELLNLIEELMKHEEATIENCSKLKSQFAAEETNLRAAILEAIISDSEKHRRLLLALDKVMKRD